MFWLGRLLSGGAQGPGVFFISLLMSLLFRRTRKRWNSSWVSCFWWSCRFRGLLHLSTLIPFVQEYEWAVIFYQGRLLLVEPRVQRPFHFSILVSFLRRWYFGWVGYCGSFFTSLSMTSLYLFSGIREGGDIPAGSAAVWWSAGSK